MLRVLHLPEEVNQVMLHNVDLGGDGHVLQCIVNPTELLYVLLITFLEVLAKTSFLNFSECSEGLEQTKTFYFQLVRFFKNMDDWFPSKACEP